VSHLEIPINFDLNQSNPQTQKRNKMSGMIEVIVNDRLGKKLRIKAAPSDTIGELKLVIAAASGTKPDKIVLKKWYTVFKDHITLDDYEIHDGASLEMYYQ